MVKDLKVVLGKGKGGGSKMAKNVEKNADKNAENNGNETSELFEKDQYFGTYHIRRTSWCVMQLTSWMWRRMCAKHWSVPC
jgi:hypothetical protein